MLSTVLPSLPLAIPRTAAGPLGPLGSMSADISIADTSSVTSQPDLPGQFSYLDRSPPLGLSLSPSSEAFVVVNAAAAVDSSRSPGAGGSCRSPSYFAPLPPPVEAFSMRSSSLSPSHQGRGPGSSPPARAFSPPGYPFARSLSNTRSPKAGSPPPPSLSPTYARSSFAPDTLPSPGSPDHHVVQRLTQQNSMIREAWELERNHLEASRKRAEDVFREERAIMDEVRETLEADRVALLKQVNALACRVQALEHENTLLKSLLPHSGPLTAGITPPRRPCGWNLFREMAGLTSASLPASR